MTAPALRLVPTSSGYPGEAVWEAEQARWDNHLLSEAKAPKTMVAYHDALKSMERWLRAEELSLDPEAMTPAIGERYMASLTAAGRAQTTKVAYYTALNLFYGWWARETNRDQAEANRVPDPWDGVGRPKLGKPPRIPVVDDATIGRIFDVCGGGDLLSKRDSALLHLIYDAGLRRHEVVGMLVEDVDFRHRRAVIWGKGNKDRVVAWGP